MTPINQEDFTTNLFTLLKETFEGPPLGRGSAYLDKGAGLFQTLDALSSEEASHVPAPGLPTIAAHCVHVGYYVRVLYNYMVGREQDVDWPASWRTQEVGPDEWEALKGELRDGYDTLKRTLEGLDSWGDDPVGDSMAIVVHTAYHLGAIRHMVRTLGSEPKG